MLTLAQLTEQDFEKMANEITEISSTQSEDELFEIIGHALHDSGLTTSTTNSYEIFRPKMIDESKERLSMKKSLKFVGDTKPMATKTAKEEGKRFWKRFQAKLRAAICNEPKIRELLEGDGTLKDYLIAGVPLIFAALGLVSLNPLALAIVAGVVALIVKVGFQSYCEIA